MESTDILQIREWLITQESDKYSLSHKAAIIRSCDPFGLMADYKDKDGTIYEYFDGNSTPSIKVEAAYKWIRIIDYKVERDVYGLKGWVRFNTERDERVNEIRNIAKKKPIPQYNER